MAKLQSILAGTVIAGALAVGIAAAPAQAATASTASTASAQATKHWFSGFSGYGHGESRAKRSSYKGYWYYSNGRYYFDISVSDRDHDNEQTYLDFYYHEKGKGWQFGRRYFTAGQNEWTFDYGRNGGRFDGFRIHLGEGTPRGYDWGGYYSRSF